MKREIPEQEQVDQIIENLERRGLFNIVKKMVSDQTERIVDKRRMMAEADDVHVFLTNVMNNTLDDDTEVNMKHRMQAAKELSEITGLKFSNYPRGGGKVIQVNSTPISEIGEGSESPENTYAMLTEKKRLLAIGNGASAGMQNSEVIKQMRSDVVAEQRELSGDDNDDFDPYADED